MDATVDIARHPAGFVRQPDSWMTKLFDYKPFLVFLCLLPTMGLLLVFLTYPLGLGIWLAFTDTTIGQPGKFIGLENFEYLVTDPIFLMSVWNTIFYVTAGVAVAIAIPIKVNSTAPEKDPTLKWLVVPRAA